ncbi:MAG TPA: acyl-CoA thioesterase, partial [Polyangiaceae bacterium]
MPSAVHEYELRIIERHLDTFGHVNNATYLDLFEAARWDWITQNGYGLTRIRELERGPTILEIHLQFKRELLNRELIRIKS